MDNNLTDVEKDEHRSHDDHALRSESDAVEAEKQSNPSTDYEVERNSFRRICRNFTPSFVSLSSINCC
jgi:hypothetical protein